MACAGANSEARPTGDPAEAGRDRRPRCHCARGNDRSGYASGRRVVDRNTTAGSRGPVDTRVRAGVRCQIYRDGAAVPIGDSMIKGLISAVIGSRHDRERRKIQPTGDELTWDMVPYDVQLMGGIELHLGKIAEMATGEGKTLVATLPLYLNALPGKGAHLVTVNSYLARRDSQWMGHVYNYIGLTVGCIDDTEPGTEERRNAYLCDITYGTNNEFGFDYLRDNMVQSPAQRVQRSHIFAIVDEVDSVLIDEARTPLIISGPVGNDNDPMYFQYNSGVERLVKRQTELVNSLVGEAERDLEKGDADLGAMKLYKAQLGSPKNRRLFKLLQEPGNKTLVQKKELEHIADRRLPASKQQYRELEDDLLFVLDEKGHQVHLTDRGVDFMSPGDHESFILPDISVEIHHIDHDATLSPEERIEQRRKLELEYAQKSERLHVVHQLLRAHALYDRDV